MLALYRCGRHAEALRLFQQFRRRLGEDLGIEPTPDLRRLEERILLHDVGPRAVGPAETVNPYKGLHAFDEADADEFFGREALIDILEDRLASGARFTAIVGPSGSGKSSVVKAGLIPRLRSADQRWVVVKMVPGSDPFAELSLAVAETVPDLDQDNPDPGGWDDLVVALQWLGSSGRVLVFIDQFEELFTLVRDKETRGRFLEMLTALVAGPAGNVGIVVTLRADHYHQPLLYPGFADLFTGNVVHVTPFTSVEYEAATVEPAKRAGIEIEPALLAEVIGDVTDQPGALPLFEYALTTLFDHAKGPTLQLEDYRSVGGIRGALAQTAENLYQQLDEERQEIVRQIALRMVVITEDAEPERRRVRASEIAELDVDPGALRDVVEEFGRRRLLTFDRDAVTSDRTIEVAHEALLREWDRLRAWIDSAREDIRRRAALAAAIAEWEDSGRDPGFLLDGIRLDRCEQWLQSSSVRLTVPERHYVDLARQHREDERREQETRGDRRAALERRSRSRLRAAVIAVVLLLGAIPILMKVLPSGPTGPKVALMWGGRDMGFGGITAMGWDQAVRDIDLDQTEVVPFTGVEESLRDLSARNDLVIVIGFLYSNAVAAVAPEFPDVRYVLVDEVIDRTNVTSVIFSEQEGSFLAGAAAAMTTTSGIVGFVGGVPSDVIERFRAGYESGVKTIDPTITVLVSYVTTDLAVDVAFSRPDLGTRAAEALYDRGADVIYHAAGGSGDGVIDAAVEDSMPDRHLWVIGVDVDQYVTADVNERPHVLTSMLKRVDVAVYESVRRFVDGTLDPGIVMLDLAAGGVGLSDSGGFIEDWSVIEDFEQRIATGDLTVPDTAGYVEVVLAQVVEPTQSGKVTFDGQECTYDGPDLVTFEDALLLTFHGIDPAGGALAVVAALPGTDETDMRREGRVDEVPPFMDPSATSHVIPLSGMGTTSIIVEPEATAYVLYCLTGFDPSKEQGAAGRLRARRRAMTQSCGSRVPLARREGSCREEVP